MRSEEDIRKRLQEAEDTLSKYRAEREAMGVILPQELGWNWFSAGLKYSLEENYSLATITEPYSALHSKETKQEALLTEIESCASCDLDHGVKVPGAWRIQGSGTSRHRTYS